jgi:hypothetical protein
MRRRRRGGGRRRGFGPRHMAASLKRRYRKLIHIHTSTVPYSLQSQKGDTRRVCICANSFPLQSHKTSRLSTQFKCAPILEQKTLDIALADSFVKANKRQYSVCGLEQQRAQPLDLVGREADFRAQKRGDRAVPRLEARERARQSRAPHDKQAVELSAPRPPATRDANRERDLGQVEGVVRVRRLIVVQHLVDADAARQQNERDCDASAVLAGRAVNDGGRAV